MAPQFAPPCSCRNGLRAGKANHAVLGRGAGSEDEYHLYGLHQPETRVVGAHSPDSLNFEVQAQGQPVAD